MNCGRNGANKVLFRDTNFHEAGINSSGGNFSQIFGKLASSHFWYEKELHRHKCVTCERIRKS